MTSRRPYVVVSCAQSIDGYINDATHERLILSNDEDFDKVDELRASVDAILIGANTVREDNPRLMVRSEVRQAQRLEHGLSANPLRVILANSLHLDPQSRIFMLGDTRLVYCPNAISKDMQAKLGKDTSVVGLGEQITIPALLDDLVGRGVNRLMVEGGSSVLTQFLAAGLVDELRLVTAGFFVGNSKAPRFVGDGHFHWDKDHRMKLDKVASLGDVVVATYISPELEATDRRWMDEAFKLSQQCPPTDTAYSVGAIVVDRNGNMVMSAFSRETDDRAHAEEAALIKLGSTSLDGATMYSTLEPCSKRVSRPGGCAQLILRKAGIRRVVYAVHEPLFMQDCKGDEMLREAGLTVRVMDKPEYGYDALFRELNKPTFDKFEGDNK